MNTDVLRFHCYETALIFVARLLRKCKISRCWILHEVPNWLMLQSGQAEFPVFKKALSEVTQSCGPVLLDSIQVAFDSFSIILHVM